jgi:molybdenum cofactor cytidylyltransferase
MTRGTERVAAVILAAGGSSRLGRPKQLLQLAGETLLHRTARMAIESGCDPVVVVLGAVVEQARKILADLDVRIAINDRWPEGLGTSVSVGISALNEAEAALVLVCDQAMVNVESLRKLRAAYDREGRGIVASRYAGTLGVPVLFSRAYFPALRGLNGDSGARTLLQQFATEVVAVDLPEGAVDVDVAADWEALQHG